MESLHHKALQGLHFPSSPEAKTPCSQCRGAWVQSLVRELDLVCHNWRSCMPQWGWKIPCAATKTQSSQINIYIYIYIFFFFFKETAKLFRSHGAEDFRTILKVKLTLPSNVQNTMSHGRNQTEATSQHTQNQWSQKSFIEKLLCADH